MKKIISIDQFLAEGGNIQKLEPKHIVLLSYFETLDIDEKTGKIIPVSIQLGEVEQNYNAWRNYYYSTQMYLVTYLKNDKEITKTVAGHLIDVEIEVVLSESFK